MAQQNRAFLPNGQTLNFPPGTSPEQIKIKVREYTATTPVASSGPVTPYGLPKAGAPPKLPVGLSEGGVSKELSKLDTIGDKPRNASELLSQAIPLATSVMFPEVYAASGIAKAIPALAKLSPAVLTSLGFGVGDAAVRASKGEPARLPEFLTSGNKPLDITSDALLGASANEIAGGTISKLGGKVLAAFNEVTKPGSILGSKRALELTPAQYTKSESAKLFEDNLIRDRKEEMVAKSNELATKKANAIASDFAGKGVEISEAGLQAGSEEMRLANKEAFTKILNASNAEAEAVNLDAARVVVKTKPGKLGTPATILPNGSPQAAIPGVPATKVEGPIQPNILVKKIVSLRKEAIDAVGKPDPDDPFISHLNSMLDDLVDENGKIYPIAFDTAWKQKSIFGTKAYGNPLQDANFTDSRYKQLYSATDKDIRASLPEWDKLKPGVGTSALEHYENATALVNKRHAIWNLAGETGGGAKTLLNTMNDPSPAVNAVFDDYKKLNRFLETGNLGVNGITVNKNNITPTAKAYQFSRLFHEAWDASTVDDIAKGTINRDAITKKFNGYLNSAQGKRLYNAPERERIASFIDDVSNIDPASTRSKWLELKYAYGAISILGGVGGYLATQNMSTSAALSLAGGVVSFGVVLGLRQIGKLLVNKTAAPIISAMAKGAPLGMSEQAAARIIAQVLRGEKIKPIGSEKEIELK